VQDQADPSPLASPGDSAPSFADLQIGEWVELRLRPIADPIWLVRGRLADAAGDHLPGEVSAAAITGAPVVAELNNRGSEGDLGQCYFRLPNDRGFDLTPAHAEGVRSLGFAVAVEIDGVPAVNLIPGGRIAIGYSDYSREDALRLGLALVAHAGGEHA
jgi:hypothetical protein